MLVVHVHVHVKPECVEVFKAATLENARVVDLRAMARRLENFPIKGRDVARAGRDELLAAFRSLNA